MRFNNTLASISGILAFAFTVNAIDAGEDFMACEADAKLNPDKIEKVIQNLKDQRDKGVKYPVSSFDMKNNEGEDVLCSYTSNPNMTNFLFKRNQPLELD